MHRSLSSHLKFLGRLNKMTTNKSFHRWQGYSLLIAIALLFIPLPFIDGKYIASVIILINAFIEIFN